MKFPIGFIGVVKPAVIVYAGGGNQGNDTPTHNFTVDLGDEDATRHVLVCTRVNNSNLQTGDPDSVVVNGVTATQLTSQAAQTVTKTWWMAAVPTGGAGVTVAVTRTGGTSGAIHCTAEVWSCYFLINPFAEVDFAEFADNTSPNSVDVSVLAGGIVAACGTTVGTAGGQSDTHTYSGVNTDDSGISTDSETVSGGSIALAAADASFTVGIAFLSGRNTNLQAISLR
jgi:hypothetical protein